MRPLSPSQFFSLMRTLFGLWLVCHFFFLIPVGEELFSSNGIKVAGGALYLKEFLAPLRSPLGIKILLILSTLFALFFTLKIFRRSSSLFLFFAWIFLFHQDLLSYNPGLPYVGWLLLAMTLIDSNEERFFWENKNPHFVFPPVLFWGLWLVVALGHSASGIHKFLYSPLWREGRALVYIFDYPASRSELLLALYLKWPLLIQKILNWSVILIEATFFVALLVPRVRKTLWFLNVLMHVGILITLKFTALSIFMLIIHGFMIECGWYRFGGVSYLKKPNDGLDNDKTH